MKTVKDLIDSLSIYGEETPVAIFVRDSGGIGLFYQIRNVLLRTDVDPSALYQERTVVVTSEEFPE
jgi:hypothetical protein